MLREIANDNQTPKKTDLKNQAELYERDEIDDYEDDIGPVPLAEF